MKNILNSKSWYNMLLTDYVKSNPYTDFNENNDEIVVDELMIDNHIDYQKIFSEMNNLCTFKDLSKAVENTSEKDISFKKEYNMCPICKIPCKISDTFIICTQCGVERVYDCHVHDLYSLSIESNYNTANNSFMTFNIVGTNSYNYNRSLLKTCADYSSYRANSNKKEIINKIYQFEGNKPPMNVINETAALFDQIKQAERVYRGDGKLGVIGACLYYVSIKNNLTRSPKEIANIMGIEERFLSQGDRVLQELAELGIIEIPTNYKPLNDYLNMYMPCLGIDDKYKQFVIDTIARAEKKHLHIRHECRLTTKVVGVLYLLTLRVPELRHIKKDTISIECNISKSTFIKYCTLICDNHIIMKKVFRKHHLPMDKAWR
jgi:Transcription factor TFIIB repeat